MFLDTIKYHLFLSDSGRKNALIGQNMNVKEMFFFNLVEVRTVCSSLPPLESPGPGPGSQEQRQQVLQSGEV